MVHRRSWKWNWKSSKHPCCASVRIRENLSAFLRGIIEDIQAPSDFSSPVRGRVGDCAEGGPRRRDEPVVSPDAGRQTSRSQPPPRKTKMAKTPTSFDISTPIPQSTTILLAAVSGTRCEQGKIGVSTLIVRLHRVTGLEFRRDCLKFEPELILTIQYISPSQLYRSYELDQSKADQDPGYCLDFIGHHRIPNCTIHADPRY